MYDKEDIIRVLMKDLKSEFEAIHFYLDNISKFNYKSNKKAFDKLVLDSIDHSEKISKLILKLNKDSEGRLKRGVLRKSMLEEKGLRELYLYESKRTDNKSVKKVLMDLAKAEEKHEKLIKSLK